MKKAHIIGIVVIAVSIGAIISTISDSSTYAGFNEVFNNPGHEYHVVGEYVKDKSTEYNPKQNPDLFIFWMEDKDGREQKVYLNKSKPQDFERSEQVVLIGKASGDKFIASDILMKCPSKYNEQQKVAQESLKEAS